MADSVMTRLVRAMNGHDPAAVAALFADDYRSEQPLHPSRGFGGSEQVLANWTSVFEGVPDFSAEVVASGTGDGATWTEHAWRGTHPDGTPFLMRGVTVMGFRDEQVAWARLYLEPVEQGGRDIDEAVKELYRAPDRSEPTTSPNRAH